MRPFSSLPAPLRGALAFTLLALNTLFWSVLLFLAALVKLALPFAAVRRAVDPVLNGCATGWVTCNSLWMRLLHRTQWDVQGLPARNARGWYLVNCNHQSWADIFVLQHLLNGRIPLLKFFLKRELIYVPVIGLAWWALDFPFMKRHGKAQLRRHPERRGEDLAAARRACGRFGLVPTSVMNFAEGTRFTPGKHARQSPPYRHLLEPKTGALALTLQTLGDKFDAVIDVTIAYQPRVPGFWAFLSGQPLQVSVRMRELPVPADLCAGDYAVDAALRQRLREWVSALWRDKDRQLQQLLGTR